MIVRGIFTSPSAGEKSVIHDSIEIVEGGLVGDRYLDGTGHWQKMDESKGRLQKPRDVSFVDLAELEKLAQENGITYLHALELGDLSRRNIVVETGEGETVSSFIGSTFASAGVILEGIEDCDPCTRPNKVSGGKFPGFHKLPPEAGMRARVLQPGILEVGQTFEIMDDGF